MGGATAIDEAAVSRWMATHAGAREPLTFTLIAGGRSNLTFRVRDADGRDFALRRPPTSHVLPTAHDMTREYRILSALAPLGVPVPAPLALCTDDEINGPPFYVMEFVDGAILRTRADAESTFDVATRAHRRRARHHARQPSHHRRRSGRAGRPRSPRRLHRAPTASLAWSVRADARARRRWRRARRGRG